MNDTRKTRNTPFDPDFRISQSHQHRAESPPTRLKMQYTREDPQTSFTGLLRKLHLQDRFKNKLTPAEFLQIEQSLKQDKDLQESNLYSIYLYKLLMLDYRARYIQVVPERTNAHDESEQQTDFFEDSDDLSEQIHIHPMDIQMAVLHCSDSFLKQKIVTKLSQCQYALPLLVPNPLTGEIECPLWTFQPIQKTWKKSETKNGHSVVTMKSMSICKAETLMVLCFRLGSLSESKSQLINTLINDRHSTFFHRNCTGSTRSRFLFDGVAEISWYCPAGKPNDTFLDCVAFCNLHGDGLTYDKQLNTLMDKASVNVVFVKTLDRKEKSAELIIRLFESTKPLIVLIENSGKSVNQVNGKNVFGLKYKVGLKDRSHSDVSVDLKRIIRDIMDGPHKLFNLQSMTKTGLRVDEHDTSCSKGLSCTDEMMTIMKSACVSDVQTKFLPCQGKLWNDWSRTNKELYHLKGNIEFEKQKKLNECKKLRERQCEASCGKLVKSFVRHLSDLHSTEKEYFLKWTEILLDDHATNQVSSILQSYNQKWSEMLVLKKQFEDKNRPEVLDQKKTQDLSIEIKSKQEEISKLSQDLHSAKCGLEHIFREMAQIYEAHKSLGKPQGEGPADWSTFPELAAELMMSGHPMELMDGDAGHVPLTWIKSLMEQLVLKLGDKRVFVLSVLGLQSSGKSTMLNTLFGLQFAVSAGRCTRGAFMQLVKLSENIMEEFQWEYLLVVDTEGLRALELEANQKTLHHDNELATFVVGLGNMTLMNIFGENPSDMQDVLQIVVQAFMRMREVKLSPSCVFVHQNVTDVSATERNMDGRRKLLEKLDMMVQLAAKEEVCDAGSFSDIIDFDVQKDVKYFAQLWEGSPPMAPPNPGYSDCVQELKSYILEKGKTSAGVTLQEFKTKIGDLWSALLNENFVFSFKNTLEIAAYRKLEVEYGHWTWALRSEMLKIEEKLYTEISNGKLDHVDSSLLYGEVNDKFEEIKKSMAEYFENEEDKEVIIQWQVQHELKMKDSLDEVIRGLVKKLNNLIEQKKASKEVDEKKAMFENTLLQKSKNLALHLKDKLSDDKEMENEFNQVWRSWVCELTIGIKPAEAIALQSDQIQAIHENGFEVDLTVKRKTSSNYKDMAESGDYTQYIGQKRFETQEAAGKQFQFLEGRLPQENQEQIRSLIKDVEKQASELIKQKPVSERGYNSTYLSEMTLDVLQRVDEFESQWKYRLQKVFRVDLILFVFETTETWILESHLKFVRNNDVRTYLESKKDAFFSVFRSFCKGISSAVVLAELIGTTLKASIVEAVMNQTAIDVAGDMKCNVSAFKENRLNLEKHILKSLAEKKEFQRYITYIKDPQTYTKTFIGEEVKHLLDTEYKDKCHSIFKENIYNIQQQILHALHKASETTKYYGDINMWLQEFAGAIIDKVTFTTIDPEHFSDINDFEFLKEETKRRIESLKENISTLSEGKLEWFRVRPDQILIDQLCDCCWETCPFCQAVCTNTIKDHKSAKEGGIDHSTPFHRSPSVDGFHYRNTVEMSLPFCTTEVAGDGSFHPDSSYRLVPYKSYRTAGPPLDTWSITPDLYQMCYWQWVVCTFQKELEDHYNLRFERNGEIPNEWREITFKQAMENLEEMYK